MLRIYKLSAGTNSEIVDVSDLEVALKQPDAEAIWIDLLDPNPALIQEIEKTLSVDIPTREEVRLREFSNRFYREDGWTVFTFSLLAQADSKPELTPVTFLFGTKFLLTLRYRELMAFKSFHIRLPQGLTTLHRPEVYVFGLFDEISERLSDLSEQLDSHLEEISQKIFSEPPRGIESSRPDLNAALRELGTASDLCSKIRESLASLQHSIPWLRKMYFETSEREEVTRLEHDFHAIAQHADFIVNKLTFLLDATLGFINLEQNNTIKIFSVLAVIFLPPTLIASIYGMNFRHMPELESSFGYPLALITMLFAAILPYWFFKKRGWL